MAKCKKFKVGDLIIPFKNSNSHNYSCGQVYRVIQLDTSGGESFKAISTDGSDWIGNHLRYSDCRLAFMGLDYLKEKADSVQSKIQKLESELAELEAKMKWMADTGADNFDEDQYRVWQALSTIEDAGMSKLEKVKVIAALLK